MKRSRYFTETFARLDNPHDRSNPNWQAKIHTFASEAHCIQIDDNTIVGIVHLKDPQFSQLQNHDTICLHPSIHDKTSLKDHLTNHGKKSHHDALVNYAGVTNTDTVMDMVAKMVAKGNIFLAPDK